MPLRVVSGGAGIAIPDRSLLTEHVAAAFMRLITQTLTNETGPDYAPPETKVCCRVNARRANAASNQRVYQTCRDHV